MNFTTRVPLINVKVTSVFGDVFEMTNVDFGGDIISVDTNKVMGNEVAGTFTVVMIARKNITDFYNSIKVIQGKSSKTDSQYKVFRPMGLVDIEINGLEVMIGIIDSVNRTMSIGQDGKPSRAYTISGRDFGAFLVDHKVWWDDSISSSSKNQNSLVGPAYLFGPIGASSPSKILQEIINNWFYKVVNREMPGADNVFKFADEELMQDKFIVMQENEKSYDIIDYVTTKNEETGVFERSPGGKIGTQKGPGALSVSTYGNYYPLTFQSWNYQGDLFNFAKSFASSPFNEIYVETGDCEVVMGNPYQNGQSMETIRDTNGDKSQDVSLSSIGLKSGRRTAKLAKGKGFLVFRPCPFDDINFGIEPLSMPSMLKMSDLVEYNITDEDIVSKSLAISRNGIPSFYFVNPAGGLITGAQGRYFTPPSYDYKSLSRYGYSPMEVKLECFNLMTKNFKDGDTKDICSKFQDKLKSWFSISDKLFRGNFVIKGREEIRIGNRLNYNSIDGEIEEPYEEGYYYVTGVAHSYKYAMNYTSTVTVDRGVSKFIVGEQWDSSPKKSKQ